MEYTITSEVHVNDEGSDFVELAINWEDGAIERHSFHSYFDDPGASAVIQASSFVAAFEDSQRFTLEQRLGPYGLEWEREQLERNEIPF